MSTFLTEKIKELEAYRPALTKRPDFDAFWEETRRKADRVALNPQWHHVPYPSPYVQVYNIAYDGFDATPIKGYFIRPNFPDNKGSFPCLIQYHGFGGRGDFPAALMHWVMLGMGVLSIDCRGQSGETGNLAGYSGGAVANVTTFGILDKNEYYYRALYMDSLRAVDFCLTSPDVDPNRIILRGTSQGGALGMAVAALDARPALAIVNVPSNSNLERRVEGRYGAFSAVNDYVKKYPDRLDKVYQTLSYFDTMNLAERIACPIFASVALADTTCPAICYYASYNRVTAPKSICVYPFNEHDGARELHLERELHYIAKSGIL